jgi:O-antigen ligase
MDRAAAGRREIVPNTQRSAAIRWVVIGVVLAGAAWVAPLAALAERRLVALFLLPAAAAGAAALLRWPDIGFPLAVVVSLLVPFSIYTGTQSGINSAIILVGGMVGLWLMEMVARQREIRLVDSPTIRPLVAFMAVSLLSMGFGQVPWLPTRSASLSAQIGGLTILLLCPAAFILVAHRLRSLRALQAMTWIFIALGGVFVALLLVPSLQPLALRTYQRAVIDSLFWTWIVTLSFSQSLLNHKLARGWRIALALVALGAFYFTIVLRQSWTSGWLPASVSVVTILIIKRPKPVIAGLVVVGVIALILPGLAGSLFLGGDNEYSLTTRVEAWRILLEIIKLNPILGLGPANYYGYTSLYNILGYTVSFNSHNNYVDIIAQVGLAGLACFLWFAAAMGRVTWRLRNEVPEGFSRAYVLGALGGLAATLVSGMFGDWILPFVYNVGLEGFRASGLGWMFLGAVVALAEIHRGDRAATAMRAANS